MAYGPLGQGSGWNGSGYATRDDATAAGGHLSVNPDGTPNGTAVPAPAPVTPAPDPIAPATPAPPPANTTAPAADSSVPPPANPPTSGTPPDAQAGGTTTPPPQTFHSTKTNQDYTSQTELDAAEGAFDLAQNQNQQAQNQGNSGSQADASSPAPSPAPAASNPASASTPYDEAMAQAKALSTNTEDPAYKVAFNRAVTSFGLANDAQRAKLQEQINQNPALAGQGAGTALLMMVARDANLNFDQAVAQLSEQSAQHISDINKYGLDKIVQITQAREQYKTQRQNDLLAAGDYNGYADQVEADTGHRPNVDELKEQSPATITLANTLVNQIDAKLSAGDEEGAKVLYAQLQGIQPKSWGSISWDDYRTGPQKFALRTKQNDTLDTRIRNDIQKVPIGGDYSTVINDLHQRYTEDESTKGGEDLIKGGVDLTEANRLLKQAGMDEVKSLDELTANGRQDDLFIASKLDKEIVGAASATHTIEKDAKTYANILGLDSTNPDVVTQLSAFLRQNPFTVDASGNLTFNSSSLQDPLSYTDPTNTISQHFVDWPVVDVDGKSLYSGWQPYSASNQHAAPGSPTYQFENSLNSAYEKYLNTPGDHVSRQDWFNSVTGNKDNWKDGVLTPSATGVLATGRTTGTTGFTTPTGDGVVFTTPGISTDDKSILTGTSFNANDKVGDVAKFQTAFNGLNATDKKAYLSTPQGLQRAIRAGSIGDYSNPANIKYSEADYVAQAQKAGGWIAAPNGKAYQMEKSGNAYNVALNGVGWGFLMTGADGKKYFMVTKTADGGNGKAVGSILPISTTNTTEGNIGATSVLNHNYNLGANLVYYYGGGSAT